ncbi:hypothetical protein GDO86_018886 [Hymenochirus boettgeri]|uniref:Uncharacterized protein n=1 Tax=Hymenochirus boettgeri TaxID=247094 RepID=A0A8T2I9W0_9PIPI|nr:hypothetical protein GDO86_018886 [Hymenochirus boettgeri]
MDLGYHIHNSEVLFRITKNEEPGRHRRLLSRGTCEGSAPDIVLRINYLSDQEDLDEESVRTRNGKDNPSDFPPRIKQEEVSFHQDCEWIGDRQDEGNETVSPGT